MVGTLRLATPPKHGRAEVVERIQYALCVNTLLSELFFSFAFLHPNSNLALAS